MTTTISKAAEEAADASAATNALTLYESAQQVCRDVLQPALMAIMHRNYPVGLVIGLNDTGVRLNGGNARNATHARVELATLDHMDWSRLENTGVLLRCVPLKANGQDMKEEIRLSVKLLHQKDPSYRETTKSRREVLIGELDALATATAPMKARGPARKP